MKDGTGRRDDQATLLSARLDHRRAVHEQRVVGVAFHRKEQRDMRAGRRVRGRGPTDARHDEPPAVPADLGVHGVRAAVAGHRQRVGARATFLETVIPLLQQRGAVRTEYTGTTLREHLREF
jgi:hypothetical protein